MTTSLSTTAWVASRCIESIAPILLALRRLSSFRPTPAICTSGDIVFKASPIDPPSSPTPIIVTCWGGVRFISWLVGYVKAAGASISPDAGKKSFASAFRKKLLHEFFLAGSHFRLAANSVVFVSHQVQQPVGDI